MGAYCAASVVCVVCVISALLFACRVDGGVMVAWNALCTMMFLAVAGWKAEEGATLPPGNIDCHLCMPLVVSEVSRHAAAGHDLSL